MLTISCLLMSGHGQSHKSALEWSWVQFWSQSLEMEIRCVKCMYYANITSSKKKNQGLKGFSM